MGEAMVVASTAPRSLPAGRARRDHRGEMRPDLVREARRVRLPTPRGVNDEPSGRPGSPRLDRSTRSVLERDHFDGAP
jgi:hypothetical protein